MINVAVFEALDFATGIIKGLSQKKLKSNVMFKGFCKKMLVFIFYCTALMLDRAIPAVTNGMFADIVYTYIIVMETVSIAENTMDAELIKRVKEFLKK